MSITTAFVDRTHQLAQLDRFLAQALSAHGQICFVTGDAGAGKTTLALEFIRRPWPWATHRLAPVTRT